jgi:hypothetical protein
MTYHDKIQLMLIIIAPDRAEEGDRLGAMDLMEATHHCSGPPLSYSVSKGPELEPDDPNLPLTGNTCFVLTEIMSKAGVADHSSRPTRVALSPWGKWMRSAKSLRLQLHHNPLWKAWIHLQATPRPKNWSRRAREWG